MQRDEYKAFAIAIDDYDKQWANGFSWGYKSQKKANEVAMAHCEASRVERDIINPCKIYADGNNIK